MTQYAIVYIGGDKPASPEEGKEHFGKYMAWIKSLGAAALSPANPLKDTRTVSPDGSVSEGSVSSMSGYTIVEADTIDAVIEMARSCPFLDINGTLEVSELVQMSL